MNLQPLRILGVCLAVAGLVGISSCREALRVPPENQPPMVALAAELDESDPLRMTVNFTISAIDSEGSVASVILDFGDGNLESIPPNSTSRTSHTYDTAAEYTAKATATDDEGSPASASTTIMVGFTTGACCLAQGMCQDGQTQAMCDNLVGLFVAGAACNEQPSPCTACPDRDNDGWAVCDSTCQPGLNKTCGDCDDTSPTAAETFPGAAPNNSSTACMRDADGDGYGDVNGPANGDAGTDCDDTPITGTETFPGAAPNDSSTACMRDADGDDYGDVNSPAGGDAGTDCDDVDPTVNPATSWHEDLDNDTFGNPNVTVTQCARPAGFVQDDTDCDDGDAAINPLATELCDGGVDNDCNAVTPDVCFPCVDADSDAWAESCSNCDHDPTKCNDCDDSDPNNWISCATCLDTDGDTFFDGCDAYLTISGPDCDAGVATCTTDCLTDVDNDTTADCADTCLDRDGDTYGDPGGAATNTCAGTDCDDTSPTAAVTFPGAAPFDNPAACMRDADGDDYGDDSAAFPVIAGTDCDDTPGTGASINRGQTESPFMGRCSNVDTFMNPIDDDCDGAPNTCDTACTSFLMVLNTLQNTTASHTAFPNPQPWQTTCAGCHSLFSVYLGPVNATNTLNSIYLDARGKPIEAPPAGTHFNFTNPPCSAQTTPPTPCPPIPLIVTWKDEGAQCTECDPPEGIACTP